MRLIKRKRRDYLDKNQSLRFEDDQLHGHQLVPATGSNQLQVVVDTLGTRRCAAVHGHRR
jgi:hypothetical protein